MKLQEDVNINQWIYQHLAPFDKIIFFLISCRLLKLCNLNMSEVKAVFCEKKIHLTSSTC